MGGLFSFQGRTRRSRWTDVGAGRPGSRGAPAVRRTVCPSAVGMSEWRGMDDRRPHAPALGPGAHDPAGDRRRVDAPGVGLDSPRDRAVAPRFGRAGRVGVKGLLATIGAMLLAGCPPPAARSAEPTSAGLVGVASVVDADTVEVRGERVRLFGVDAFESSQTCRADGKPYRCGQQAALALADKIGRRPIACERRDTDRYGRTVSVCRLGGEDLNGWLVSEGWALAYRAYSTDYDDARLARRGAWRGEFTLPWEWRKQRGRRSGGRTVPGHGDGAKAGLEKAEPRSRALGAEADPGLTSSKYMLSPC